MNQQNLHICSKINHRVISFFVTLSFACPLLSLFHLIKILFEPARGPFWAQSIAKIKIDSKYQKNLYEFDTKKRYLIYLNGHFSSKYLQSFVNTCQRIIICQKIYDLPVVETLESCFEKKYQDLVPYYMITIVAWALGSHGVFYSR